jgi:hypothetical protein
MRQTAAIEGVAANQFVAASLSQPTEQIFRVIERHARVCGGIPAAREVKLDVTHPSWNLAGYHYHIDFDWTLQ